MDRAPAARLPAAGRAARGRVGAPAGRGSGAGHRREAGLRGEPLRRLLGAPGVGGRLRLGARRPDRRRDAGDSLRGGDDGAAGRLSGLPRGPLRERPRLRRGVDVRHGPAGDRLRARRRLPRRPTGRGRSAPPRLLRGARRQPVSPVLALLRGLDQPPGRARKGRLARGRLGGLPGADRTGWNRRPSHLPSRLQLRRRRGKLALGRRPRPPLGLGAVHRPPVRLGRQPRGPRPRGPRAASASAAGPRPTASPWSRSRPSTRSPAAPGSRWSLPGASRSTAIRRIRGPDPGVVPRTRAPDRQVARAVALRSLW